MDYFQPVIRSGPGSITYNSATNTSTIPHLFNNDDRFTPVVMTTPPLTPGPVSKLRKLGDLYALPNDSKFLAAGQILEVPRRWWYWTVDGDWRGHEDKLIVGWQVDMEVELPRTYFRLQRAV